jgi:polysaccharide biosynthesis/export protein
VIRTKGAGVQTWYFAQCLRLRLGLAVILLLAACTPGRNMPPLPEEAAGPYLLGPGDVVRIITFGDQQLTAEFRVSDAGNIAIPLLGNVHAAGLSTSEIQKKVEEQMVAKKLFRDPSVAVEVISYRPVFVLGEVAKPGQYPYQPGMTVLTAVAVAGGFTYRAVDDYAAIVRTIGPRAVEGRVSRETAVQPGDTITIFERRF